MPRAVPRAIRGCGFKPRAQAVTFSATRGIPDGFVCAHARSMSVVGECPLLRATLNALSTTVRPRRTNVYLRLGWKMSWLFRLCGCKQKVLQYRVA